MIPFEGEIIKGCSPQVCGLQHGETMTAWRTLLVDGICMAHQAIAHSVVNIIDFELSMGDHNFG